MASVLRPEFDKLVDRCGKGSDGVVSVGASAGEITGTADELKKFRDYIGHVLKFVESEIKAGKSKEEILKATIIPGGEEWKTEGIQRPLTAAYEELSVKK